LPPAKHGVDAFLIGEALMRATDPGGALLRAVRIGYLFEYYIF
jgi:indole-3-glycerol phosphate synthase